MVETDNSPNAREICIKSIKVSIDRDGWYQVFSDSTDDSVFEDLIDD